jgi:pyruvate dehydrogenase E2 component (dihydrolipoamide acetyltransferase)
MIEITMPRLSDTMEEGAVASWQVEVGDKVSPGDVIAEIETDKAVMDFEAYEPGTVTELLVEPGSAVSIGQPIALLDDGSGEAPAPRVEAAPGGAPPKNRSDEGKFPGGATQAPPEPGQAARPASPLVRRMAREHDVDLRTVAGSGPGGRIIRVDVERALADRDRRPAVKPRDAAEPRPAESAAPGGATVGDAGSRSSTEAPVSQARRVIARRLTASARDIPVFTATMAARVDELLDLRRQVNEHLARVGRGRVSVNDLVVRASALALRQFPGVNASWNEDSVLLHGRVNIGIAVAAERGLVAPVVMDADAKTPAQIGAEARSLAASAVNGKLTPEQMSGGTFTVSNLGMYGVEEFTAIINPPEAAILAVGAARPEVALDAGTPVERQVMRMTLSADHRLIDGALGAQFLGAVRSLLEDPWALLA